DSAPRKVPIQCHAVENSQFPHPSPLFLSAAAFATRTGGREILAGLERALRPTRSTSRVTRSSSIFNLQFLCLGRVPAGFAVEASAHRPTWKTLLAFAIIYLVWGSTFLAIRVGVREVPPFLLAAMRFTVAGLVLYVWMLARGEPSPSGRQWLSATILAVLIFVIDYGLVFR